MRKHVSLPFAAALFFILVFQSALSQNGSPYWSLAGNSNASGASKLGTTNSTPLRLFTNNVERLRIDPSGNIGVGITSPIGKFSIRGSGGTPAGSWVTAGAPIFTGFGESTVGNGDFILSMASNTANARGVLLLRRARGTLAAPTAVSNNDYLGSLLGSGYDGNSFQNPATIDLYVDGTPSSGNVPARISLVTGSNSGNRTERLVVKSNGYIGIGTNSPSNELHVIGRGRFSNGLSIEEAGIFSSHSSGNGIEAYGNTSYGAGAYGSGYYGVYGSGGTYGVYGNGSSYGIYGSGGTYGVYSLGSVYGVYGNGASYGLWGDGAGTGSYGTLGFGDFAGIYGSGNTWGGYFAGSVYTTGTYQGSDRKLKQNITDMTSAIDLINQLQPKTYEFRHDGSFKHLNLPQGKHYGLLAQDLEKVLPTLVKNTTFDINLVRSEKTATPDKPKASQAPEVIEFKAVNYTELIPVLVKAIQEQQAEIEVLKNEVSRLKQGQNGVTYSGTGSLSQNIPNPVQGTTRISYSLPSGASRGQLLLTDATGKTLKAVSLATSGVVDLNTTSLPSGTYSYSLMADGKIIETKKLTVVRQ